MCKLSLIKDIQENTLSEYQLIECLDIDHVALAALSLLDTTESVEKYDLEMVKLNNRDKEIIEKLKQSEFFI